MSNRTPDKLVNAVGDSYSLWSVADGILSVLARAELKKPILLHDFGDTVWPFVERAVRDGFSTRVGLEDGCVLPDGSVAPSNAELVRAAVQIAYGP